MVTYNGQSSLFAYTKVSLAFDLSGLMLLEPSIEVTCLLLQLVGLCWVG